MIHYECYEDNKKLLKPKKQGSRTLLRLHRALNFLMKFVQKLYECENKHASEIFLTVYNETLSLHHTWLVRKSVKFASYTIPSREKLLISIIGTEGEIENLKVKKEQFIQNIKRVYERVQVIYEKEDILNLD